ncbi:hypothetical protein H7H48_10845 [Nitratireductor sp. B36]|uniref:hypothetical protein n=1 Tax=Nitratireductor sp. B36 TaxID=2762059 RepID=UPI001E34166A|nr:hypothetical protein [Nitratireductor sp. B36]MCC5779548.1 hypothetical protein [Nitratireductor sp. B36]
MKIRAHRGFFRITEAFALAASLPLVLGGCVSASLEDAAPSAAISTPPPLPGPASQAGTGATNTSAARNTGVYPDLNIPSESAATPIDSSEKDALTRDLSAVRERLAVRAPSNDAEAEAARLRRLAKTHAERQLEEIEKSE